MTLAGVSSIRIIDYAPIWHTNKLAYYEHFYLPRIRNEPTVAHAFVPDSTPEWLRRKTCTSNLRSDFTSSDGIWSVSQSW